MSIYEGYSWSLTQHLGKVGQPRILFELLNAAHYYRNHEDKEDYINDHINALGLLPANIREGKSDIWRDYQQILPELGIMMSTRYTDTPELTNLGLQWLDGEITFEELMTNQGLKYQYPNGYKLQLPKNLNGIIGNNRAEIDFNHGVLIKPGVLILRILIELNKSEESIFEEKSLSVEEVALALMPIRRNNEWQLGLEKLQEIRSTDSIQVDNRIKRHLQEWFRFLNYGKLFTVENRRLKINPSLLSENLEELCNSHEDINTFWNPTDFQNPSSIHTEWFEHYGNVNFDNYWTENDAVTIDEENSGKLSKDVLINLTAFVEQEKSFNDSPRTGARTRQWDIEKYKESSLLHELIVNELNQVLANQGFLNYMDKNSVDLFSTKEGKSVIFEVKTLNAKNFMSRIRLGIGQLLEYKYRYQTTNGINPEAYLVINGDFELPEWIEDFLVNFLNVGLILRKSKNSLEFKCDPFSNNFLFLFCTYGLVICVVRDKVGMI
ncbi:hypothetical protein PDK45_18770 [Bacillus cereus]|nr:hypothetical protein [Bacillus cereus]